MSTYIIGFIVCEYALTTHCVKNWKAKHPDETIPIWEQLLGFLIVTATSAAWPLVLAVWMRDIKEGA